MVTIKMTIITSIYIIIPTRINHIITGITPTIITLSITIPDITIIMEIIINTTITIGMMTIDIMLLGTLIIDDIKDLIERHNQNTIPEKNIKDLWKIIHHLNIEKEYYQMIMIIEKEIIGILLIYPNLSIDDHQEIITEEQDKTI